MRSRRTTWLALGGAAVVAAGGLSWLALSDDPPGLPRSSPSPSTSEPLVPRASAELASYGRCLEGQGLTVELAGGAVFVRAAGGRGPLDQARSACRAEQKAYGRTVADKGEASKPEDQKQYDFQLRMSSCLTREGLEPQDRQDPVLLDDGADARVLTARWCLANNMLPQGPRPPGWSPASTGGPSAAGSANG
ncbi:hypothetical protein ACFC6L_02820 [Kitasatospora phosalacinea]|uniref:hypothetical protein n=1 Tax=Kitasatospora phosalacinea TaxID=2065 RepID=UPI0035E03901